MPTLTKNGYTWSGTYVQNTASKTYNFATRNTFLDKDIQLTVSISPNYMGSAAAPEITSHNMVLTSTDNNPSNVYVQSGSVKRYVQKIILDEGKNIDLEDDITNNVNISYDSTLNALVFNFS